SSICLTSPRPSRVARDVHGAEDRTSRLSTPGVQPSTSRATRVRSCPWTWFGRIVSPLESAEAQTHSRSASLCCQVVEHVRGTRAGEPAGAENWGGGDHDWTP